MELKDNVNYQIDCFEFMKQIPNNYYNLIYTDVPYNMGSEYEIDKNTGHYKFKGSGSDFMKKWEAFDGIWWSKWFEEAYRITKQGGFMLTHNIDRQSDMWSYYARRAGFFPMQKIYWLFIDSFPKGVDVALKLDNILGVERKVIGRQKGAQAESTGRYGRWGKNSIYGGVKERAGKEQKMVHHSYLSGKMSIYDKTIATSELAKKYDGYKYGQAALKQVVEEILVFWRPFDDKKMTVPKAIIQYEDDRKRNRPSPYHPSIFNIKDTTVRARPNGLERWTPQLYIQEEVAEKMIADMNHQDAADLIEPMTKIKYMQEESTLTLFVRKPNVAEREAGLETLEEKTFNDGRNKTIDNPFQRGGTKRKNIHPTPKPLMLCKKIIELFIIPDKDDMRIYDPFSGQGSIIVAADQLGIKWNGTEINEEYCKLSELKLEYYRKQQTNEPTLFGGLQ